MLSEPVTAAILVGGRARRLQGQLKPTLRVGNQTIIEHQLDAIRKAGLVDVLFVGRWPETPRTEGRHIADVVADGGALGGLYSALLVATTPIVVVLAGDLPFVNATLLRRLATLDSDDEAVVPHTTDGWHPLCAAYRRGVATRIKARLHRGALRVSDALVDMRVREVANDELSRMDADGLLLTNVNSPDDHRRAARHWAQRS